MADREEEKIRGQQAKELLENPIFKEAVQKVSEELDLEWISSPVRDTEGREKNLHDEKNVKRSSCANKIRC